MGTARAAVLRACFLSRPQKVFLACFVRLFLSFFLLSSLCSLSRFVDEALHFFSLVVRCALRLPRSRDFGNAQARRCHRSSVPCRVWPRRTTREQARKDDGARKRGRARALRTRGATEKLWQRFITRRCFLRKPWKEDAAVRKPTFALVNKRDDQFLRV